MTTHGKDDRAQLLQQAIRLKQAAARSRTTQPSGSPQPASPGQRLEPRPASADAHLGEMQRSLWLHQQLEPSSPAYNLASAFRVVGELEVPRLERSLNTVISRHRILHSTFRPHQGSALQIVHPDSPVAVEELAAEPGEAKATAVREARVPFDLTNGPLIRMLVITESAGSEQLLILVLHHILADERSLGFLWEELAAAYDGSSPDAAPQLQVDDYVHWLTRQGSPQRDTGLAFWRKQLTPLPDELRLPFEHLSNVTRPRRGRLLNRSLGSDVQQEIRRGASATETTPFIVLAFAFRLLLLRYTQGRNIAFATPVSQRSHPATATMIGYFLNPVVICTPIDEQRSVQEAIREFSTRMRNCLAHGSVPFDLLIEELSPPRQQDRQPVFQTMFVYQETPAAPELGGAQLEPITLDLGESKFDLTLFATENGGSLDIAVEYRADRFNEVWMQQLLGHYETLISQLATDLDRPTVEASMLRRQEADELRSRARGAPSASASTLLPRQILDQAQRSEAAPAVLASGHDWSYGDLARSARRIAHELTRHGVRPGDRVGLYLDRSPLMIAGLLASHWAGAAYVPLDPTYPSARNREVLGDAEVAAVLTRTAWLDQVLRDQLPAEAPILDVDRLEGDAPESWALPDLCGEHPAYILYTSGSTGRPKGVVVTHDNLSASNGARFEIYDTLPQRFLLLPSVAFDSSVTGIFWTLASGGALVIPTDDEARDPRRLARLIVERQVASLLCVPSLYAHILEAGEEPLRSLETVIVAGESCTPQLVEEHFRRLPHTRLFNEYGPTEATVWATVHEFERPNAARPSREPIAIGRPIPGVRVEVLDTLGRRVPAGIPGQGWISGPTLARGYWRRQDLTDERFVRRRIDGEPEERMYRTGDRLRWTVDGRLVFLGRADEQIKLRGFRIEPGEIEAVLRELPEVEEAAVVVRAPAQLVAFVETGSNPAAGTLANQREELAKRLPEFMVPNRIVALPQLPHLPNGKVDRRQLREMTLDLATEPPGGSGLQILDDRELALISLWEGLLGRTGIAPTDNFFRLGGHSLLVVEMTTAIERDFSIALTPAEVFQNPTVRQLARRIEDQGGPSAPAYRHLFPIQPGGRKTPFIFSVPHFFSDMVATRFRGERPVYGLRGVSLRPEGNLGRWRTMRDLGEELVDEVCHRFPGEPLIMAGYSFGATMAVEAVRLMEERGMAVRCLYLIAPMPVDFYRLGPFRVQIDGLRQPVEELTPGQALRHLAHGNSPLTARPYRRLWRGLAIQPWRKLLCLAGRLRGLAGLQLTPSILHADVRVERFRLHAGYRPGILKTPTVIFNAKEPETDAAETWRPYFQGPFTVHETPDPHLGDARVQATRNVILDHLADMEDA